MADALFAVPRLAALYDALNGDRNDLDVYAAMIDEFGASSVLDVGCGTGTLACLLAGRGKTVVGIDPAFASLEVARQKPNAERVQWLLGDATQLPPLQVDMVTMTGNVAQVFLSDRAWVRTLQCIGTALKPGGRLVFETRVPAREAWRTWTRQQSYQRLDIPTVGGVENWVDLVRVQPPLVSFRTTFVFASDGAVVTSESTLRFRDRTELTDALGVAGFTVEEIRDAPDRPDLEMVFVAAPLQSAG